jgi:uncharacterized membrane protein YuzA (DUF378 family)
MLKTITYAMIGVLACGLVVAVVGASGTLLVHRTAQIATARLNWARRMRARGMHVVASAWDADSVSARQRATSTPDNQGPSMLKTITYAMIGVLACGLVGH